MVETGRIAGAIRFESTRCAKAPTLSWASCSSDWLWDQTNCDERSNTTATNTAAAAPPRAKAKRRSVAILLDHPNVEANRLRRACIVEAELVSVRTVVITRCNSAVLGSGPCCWRRANSRSSIRRLTQAGHDRTCPSIDSFLSGSILSSRRSPRVLKLGHSGRVAWLSRVKTRRFISLIARMTSRDLEPGR